MKQKTKQRKAALSALMGLYKRPISIDLSICAYCGDPREVLDHTPALSLVHKYIDIDEYREHGGVFLLIPSCASCNSLLGARKLFTYEDKLYYLYKKYNALCLAADWREYEIEELGNSLRQMIINHEEKRKFYLHKFQGVEDKICNIEGIE